MSDRSYSNLGHFFAGRDIGAAAWVDGMDENMGPEVMQVIDMCGSPIEARLLGAMRWAHFGFNPNGVMSVELAREFNPSLGESEAGKVYLVPQAPVGNYRVDIMLYAGDRLGGWVQVAIECDGHDYHERTKEQAARDKSRDRSLATVGLHTLRFTGSEIVKDVMACVMDVAGFVTTAIRERLKAAGREMHWMDRLREGSTPLPNLLDMYDKWELGSDRDRDMKP